MPIKRARFPNQLLVLGNRRYFFGKIQKADDLWRVVRTFECNGVATVCITAIGTFGFIFPDSSSLASTDILKFTGPGSTPKEVMDNDDEIHRLQEKRILFINFILAAFFGRITAMANTALTGALFSGQNKITAFSIKNDSVMIQWTETLDQLVGAKIHALKSGKYQHYLLSDSAIDDGISYIQHLLHRHEEFAYADLQSCMLMNYQAAILHNQHQAAASFAINFSVVESLVREVFMNYGFIDSIEAQPFVARNYLIEKRVSKKSFMNMTLSKVLAILGDCGLLDNYLYQRLEAARKKRNNLMHKGVVLDPRESGDLQTTVRDIWALLIKSPFELNTGWSYQQ